MLVAEGLRQDEGDTGRSFPIAPPAPLGTVERAVAGALMGLSYALAELPNSFVKRRLGITPGDVTGRVQELADLADSVLGVMLAASLLFDVTFANFLSLLAAGTVLHLVVDRLLHARVRSKPDPVRFGPGAGKGSG